MMLNLLKEAVGLHILHEPVSLGVQLHLAHIHAFHGRRGLGSTRQGHGEA